MMPRVASPSPVMNFCRGQCGILGRLRKLGVPGSRWPSIRHLGFDGFFFLVPLWLWAMLLDSLA